MIKAPFLWMSLSSEGEVVNFLDPNGRADLSPELFDLGFEPEAELIPVSVSFMGRTHFIVEEDFNFVGFNCCNDEKKRKKGFRRSSSGVNLSGGGGGGDDCGVGEDVSGSPGSLPDRLMVEIYQHFANRTSPGSDKSRRQRRKEKERLARRKWEPEHFVKIVNCSPTESRPLQGLWKVFPSCSLMLLLLNFDKLCSSVNVPY